MKRKILEILGSVRFWLITLAWLGAYIAKVEGEGFVLSSLFDQIAFWLGTVAGVGTVDKFGNMLSGKK